jgi:two-component system sensor histidine kinase/response regulator
MSVDDDKIFRSLRESRELEKELSLTVQRFRDILENVSDWVWELDTEGNFSYASNGVEKILGYTAQEVMRMNAFDMMFPDEAERVGKVFEKIIAEKRPFRDMLNENRHKDGHPVKLLSSGVPFFDEDGNLLGYRGADRDVTEQEYIKQRFAQSEKRFRDMFNLSPDPMWVAEDNQLLECNHAAVESFAYDNRNDFLGVGLSSLMMDSVSEQTGIKNRLFSEQFTAIGSSRMTRFEWLCKRRDGSTFWGELTVTPFRMHDKGLLMFTCRDMTERKLAERVLADHQALLEEEVRNRTEELEKATQAAKQANESKSRFLANMSHELRTPMHAIMSFSNLGIKRSDSDLLKGYLQKINLSGQRLTKLLDDLLDLSKLESGKLEPVFAEDDLTLVVLQVLDQLSSLMSDKNISIDMNTDQPMVAEIDKSLIMQVVVNILSNAVKFSPEGSVISVSIEEIEHDGKRLLRYVTRDQGIGIPSDELEAVFDSFVQSSKTRSNSGGTGLGLPISREIIQMHSGRIWAETPEAGTAGTLVIFEIPLKQPAKH